MSRKPGDWDCPHCNHLNFSRRNLCQRCGEPREQRFGREVDFSSRSSSGASSYGFGAPPSGYEDVRPGDWYCGDCNAHNFASRTGCYKCGALRDPRYDSMRRDTSARRYVVASGPAASYGVTRSVWKSGDWICPRSGCEEHNFANRIECFRCSARRETGM